MDPFTIGAATTGLGIVGNLFKKKKKPKKLSRLDPMQEALRQKQMQGIEGQGPFADLYSFDQARATDVFNQNIRNPAMQQWQESAVPTITGQFRGSNLQNSSYAGEALARSGRDVQRNLDAQMAQYLQSGQQNAQANRMNAINNLQSGQTFDYQKPQQDPWSALMEGGLGLLGGYYGNRAQGRY